MPCQVGGAASSPSGVDAVLITIFAPENVHLLEIAGIRDALCEVAMFGHKPDVVLMAGLHPAVRLEKRVADTRDFKKMYTCRGKECDEHGVDSARRRRSAAHPTRNTLLVQERLESWRGVVQGARHHVFRQ